MLFNSNFHWLLFAIAVCLSFASCKIEDLECPAIEEDHYLMRLAPTENQANSIVFENQFGERADFNKYDEYYSPKEHRECTYYPSICSCQSEYYIHYLDPIHNWNLWFMITHSKDKDNDDNSLYTTFSYSVNSFEHSYNGGFGAKDLHRNRVRFVREITSDTGVQEGQTYYNIMDFEDRRYDPNDTTNTPLTRANRIWIQDEKGIIKFWRSDTCWSRVEF